MQNNKKKDKTMNESVIFDDYIPISVFAWNLLVDKANKDIEFRKEFIESFETKDEESFDLWLLDVLSEMSELFRELFRKEEENNG